jgi:hypothetical protein
MAPTIVCVAFLLMAWFTPSAGRLLADRHFKRYASEYDAVVTEIRNNRDFRSAELDVVKTKHQADKVRAVKAARCEDGSVIIAFLVDAKVPLLHEGYVYQDFSDGGTCISDTARPENNWPYIRLISGHWYHFSDQPGL